MVHLKAITSHPTAVNLGVEANFPTSLPPPPLRELQSNEVSPELPLTHPSSLSCSPSHFVPQTPHSSADLWTHSLLVVRGSGLNTLLDVYPMRHKRWGGVGTAFQEDTGTF